MLYLKVKIFQAIVRSVVLYGSEIWAVKEQDLAKLGGNDMMIQWMCNVTLKDKNLLRS